MGFLSIHDFMFWMRLEYKCYIYYSHRNKILNLNRKLILQLNHPIKDGSGSEGGEGWWQHPVILGSS